jgi:iron complex outermembrane receptor protein
MGLSSRLEYKNIDFGFSLRASLGNYVFNNIESGQANVQPNEVWSSSNYLSNRPVRSVEDGWQTYTLTAQLSDRYVHNASFLKCDNITLGYSFDKFLAGEKYKGINGRVYATVSNVFTITKYKGLDPEVFSGYDNEMYPRPISFIMGLNLNF